MVPTVVWGVDKVVGAVEVLYSEGVGVQRGGINPSCSLPSAEFSLEIPAKLLLSLGSFDLPLGEGLDSSHTSDSGEDRSNLLCIFSRGTGVCLLGGLQHKQHTLGSQLCKILLGGLDPDSECTEFGFRIEYRLKGCMFYCLL